MNRAQGGRGDVFQPSQRQSTSARSTKPRDACASCATRAIASESTRDIGQRLLTARRCTPSIGRLRSGESGSYLAFTVPDDDGLPWSIISRSPVDTLTPEERSQRMSLVRCRDTLPEKIVRRIVWRSGFRYRLHYRSLPGTPDLVFPKLRKVIFIHGCFWHRHGARSCSLARLPKSRLRFWIPKLEQNRTRDIRNRSRLRRRGWKVLVIWECQITSSNLARIQNTLKQFLVR